VENKRKDYAKSKAYKELKKDLLESLRLRGLDSVIYTDKVEEYLDFSATNHSQILYVIFVQCKLVYNTGFLF